jgi:hypothetical protein
MAAGDEEDVRRVVAANKALASALRLHRVPVVLSAFSPHAPHDEQVADDDDRDQDRAHDVDQSSEH